MLTAIVLVLALAARSNQGMRQVPPVDVELIAAATIASNVSDKSGLTGAMGGSDLPANRLGSFGSGLAYTGSGNTYLALADRGPKDGAVDFVTRFQTLSIELRASTTPATLHVDLVGTTLFKSKDGATFTGLARAYDQEHQLTERRFDPEAISVSPSGTVFTGEEYGPWIDEWSAAGTHMRRIALPAKFLAAKRAEDPRNELPPNNASGRQPNRGIEGMCFGTDGARVLCIMQGPLIQDGALNPRNERVGTNIRIVEYKLDDGSFRELLYTLDDGAHGINELLAVGPHSYIALEKDSKDGRKAKARRIYFLDVEDATDISAIAALPSTGVPAGVKPVAKRLLFDMLEARFGLAGADMPETIEGLVFGPDRADGRRVLFVASDNDFHEGQPTRFWAFALSPALLPKFERLKLPGVWKP